jgi:RsiW-degrading membrane proteinase PrsW (M82 family)
MQCEHCGRETPPGHYCAYCGAHLVAGGTPHHPTRRRHVFAANPNESVYHPGIISTFFPHLNAHRTQQFRWLLLVLALVVILLAAGRYIPIAIVAAALIVPLLYLIYFWVVEIYEDEPIWVLLMTFVVSGLLGAAFSLWSYHYVVQETRFGIGGLVPSQNFILWTALIIPVVGQILMLVGPLILYFTRPRFDEVLDGMAFGVASGLGFAAAQSIVYSWLQVTGPLTQGGDAASWVFPVIRIALFAPLLHAITTGLICAALWLRRDHTPPERALGALPSVPVALAIGFLGQIVPSLLADLTQSQQVLNLSPQILNLIWYGVTIILLMLYTRHVLHVGLIDKARALGHSGTIRCPHCFHTVPDVPFCPNCGIAMRSIAKRARRSAVAPEAASEEPETRE